MAGRDTLGRRRRRDFPVCYADTADGRLLTTRERGGDGTVWMTLVPADRRAVADRLRTCLTG